MIREEQDRMVCTHTLSIKSSLLIFIRNDYFWGTKVLCTKRRVTWHRIPVSRSCDGFDHFAAVKNILMHLVFQEITTVVSLILSSYLLMLTSPNLCVFPAATDGVSCGARCPCMEWRNILSFKGEHNTVLCKRQQGGIVTLEMYFFTKKVTLQK